MLDGGRVRNARRSKLDSSHDGLVEKHYLHVTVVAISGCELVSR